MIFEQHYLECLSQASYFIGDETTGRAVVVDPRRDVAPYLASAAEHGMTIELVIETHFHADFLSGHLELAAATGATIAYGSAAETEFQSRRLADGERISLGEVTLEIRHTPGHTPESISIVVYENAIDETPYGVLTGDTMFIGDVGRPDLLSSVGVTSEELAAQLYESLHGKIMTLPDETILYPGHGAGSSCGKNLSSATSCSIGKQRQNNYAVAPMSKDEFIAVVTEGQSAPPAYFAYDATLNRKSRKLLDESTSPTAMTLDEVLAACEAGAIPLDTRGPVDFATGHLAGSINIGLSGRYAEFAGGILSPATDIVLITEPGYELESRIRLARIGFDNVIGHLVNPIQTLSDHPDHTRRSSRLDVAGLRQAIEDVPNLQLVDVRQPGETEGGIINGAIKVPLTRLNEMLTTLDTDRPTIVYCAGGFRSSIAASRMIRGGFNDVSDLLGGYGAWDAATDTAPA